jgi:hypothetical protein
MNGKAAFKSTMAVQIEGCEYSQQRTPVKNF